VRKELLQQVPSAGKPVVVERGESGKR